MAEEDPDTRHGRISRERGGNDLEMVPLNDFGHEFGQPRNPVPYRQSWLNRIFFNKFRKIVSQNRCRFSYQGLDLDLAYITDRIIAMGYPSKSWEATFRNPMKDTVEFLNRRHGIERVKVFNLRGNCFYDPRNFSNNVITFDMTDHHPPKLELMAPFCREAAQWLAEHPENVIAVHCKAGKGRTGVMICALLIFLNFYKSPRQCLDYYSIVRTKNNKGVTIPSQRRYIYYYAKLRELELNYFPVRMQLIAVYIERPPKTNKKPCGVSSAIKIRVSNMSSVVFDPDVLEIKKEVWDADNAAWQDRIGYCAANQYQPWRNDERNRGSYVSRRGYRFNVKEKVFVEGDVRVDLLSAHKTYGNCLGAYKYEKIGHVWFNTMFASKCGLTMPGYERFSNFTCLKRMRRCNECEICISWKKHFGTTFLNGDRMHPYPEKTSNGQETSLAKCLLDPGDEQLVYCENTNRRKPKLGKLKVLAPNKPDNSPNPSMYATYGMEEPHKENARRIYEAHARGIVVDDYGIRHKKAVTGVPVALALPDLAQEPFIGPTCITHNPAEHVLTFPVYEMDRALKDKTLDNNLKIHVVLRCIDSGGNGEWMALSEQFMQSTYEKSLESLKKTEQAAQQAGYPYQRLPENDQSAIGAERTFPPAIRYSDNVGGYTGGPHPTLSEHNWNSLADVERFQRFFYRQRSTSRSRYRPNRHICWEGTKVVFRFPEPNRPISQESSTSGTSSLQQELQRYASSGSGRRTGCESSSRSEQGPSNDPRLAKTKDSTTTPPFPTSSDDPSRGDKSPGGKSSGEKSSEEKSTGYKSTGENSATKKTRQPAQVPPRGSSEETSPTMPHSSENRKKPQKSADDKPPPPTDGHEPDLDDSEEEDDEGDYRPLTVGICNFSNVKEGVMNEIEEQEPDENQPEEQEQEEIAAEVADPSLAEQQQDEEAAEAANPPGEQQQEEAAVAASPPSEQQQEEETADVANPPGEQQQEEEVADAANPPREQQQEEETADVANPPGEQKQEEEAAEVANPPGEQQQEKEAAEVANPSGEQQQEGAAEVATHPGEQRDVLYDSSQVPMDNTEVTIVTGVGRLQDRIADRVMDINLKREEHK